MQILGYILIIFAVADFGSSYAGYNLTSFLGEASRFSPIAKAEDGVAGVRRTSHFSKACLKSSDIRRRTFRALR